MSRLTALLDQIQFARSYTLRVLESVEPSLWFQIPPSGVSHIAWQVGHLAMAEYRLCLDRIRGARADDEALITSSMLKLFGRESIPDPDPNSYPPIEEIRGAFDRVHAAVFHELSSLPDHELEATPLKPHPLCQTKGECLRWCSHHEMIHVGQIGLLRRQLGLSYVW